MAWDSCSVVAKDKVLATPAGPTPLGGASEFKCSSCHNPDIAAELFDLTLPETVELDAGNRYYLHLTVASDAIAQLTVGEASPTSKCLEIFQGIGMARSVTPVYKNQVRVQITNFSDAKITIPEGAKIGVFDANINVIGGTELENHQLNEMSIDAKPSSERMKKLRETVTLDHITDPNHRQQMENLLIEFHDLFALDKSDKSDTHTSIVKHTIDVEGAKKIKQAPRPIPYKFWDQTLKELESMKKNNIIETSKSPWSSPVALVKKKNGEIRFCVDYRKVNNITRKDAFPLPRVQDSLNKLSGSKFFSTLDLMSGYWQILLDENAKDIAAFSLPTGGHWNFRTMPFGLTNAPATFQRLMERVLSCLHWSVCLIYLDWCGSSRSSIEIRVFFLK